jgi:hypothetical protein
VLLTNRAGHRQRNQTGGSAVIVFAQVKWVEADPGARLGVVYLAAIELQNR